MDPNRRITRSTSNARRNPAETEGTYWGRVIDPTDIKRGQVEAFRAVQRATAEDPTALLNTTQDVQQSQPVNNNQGTLPIMDDEVPNNLLEEEIPFTSNLTNYRSGTVNSNTVNSKFHLIRSYCEIFFYHFPNISCLKCTVNSNFHLIRSKTLLTNDFELTVLNLYTEQSLQLVNAMRTAFINNSPSTTGSMERVTTPVDMNMLEMDGPLDPAFTRPSLQRIEDLDLDTQPMKGPRESGNVTTDLLDQYIDESYADVLRTLLLNPSSYLSLPSVKTLLHHTQ